MNNNFVNNKGINKYKFMKLILYKIVFFDINNKSKLSNLSSSF